VCCSAVHSIECLLAFYGIFAIFASCCVVVTDDRCCEKSRDAAGVDAWSGGWSVLLITSFNVISATVFFIFFLFASHVHSPESLVRRQ